MGSVSDERVVERLDLLIAEVRGLRQAIERSAAEPERPEVADLLRVIFPTAESRPFTGYPRARMGCV